MADPAPHFVRHVVFDGDHMRLEYNGPPPSDVKVAENPRVVVAFAPVDYPFAIENEGWGSRSFTKRGIAHVCVFHRLADWHQNDDFFPAMKACRDFLGPQIQVTSYGFSMGGYGALLGAKTLGADRAVAVSPQFSIDPGVVRFERRYTNEWAAMSGWKHRLGQQMKNCSSRFIVLYDPLHKQDAKQEARLPKPQTYTRCLMYGVGHAALQGIVEAKIQETLFDLLRGAAEPNDLRNAFRKNREFSFRYVRKLGTRLHERKHPKAKEFFEIANRNGFHRLIKKWQPFYE